MLKITRLQFLAIFLCFLSIQPSLGIDVDISQYPNLAALRYKSNILNPYKHVCSGSIYNESIVITAASCFKENNTALNYEIVAGSDELDGCQGAVALIDRIVLHYDYSENSARNDLAVIILKTPLRIDNAKIDAIQFADREIQASTIQSVIGWRKNATAGSSLQSFMVSLFSNTRCEESVGRKRNKIICGNSGDICTQGPGSLLLQGNKLAGILSANSICNDNIQYYVNLLEYSDWLKRTLRGEIILAPKPTFL